MAYTEGMNAPFSSPSDDAQEFVDATPPPLSTEANDDVSSFAADRAAVDAYLAEQEKQLFLENPQELDASITQAEGAVDEVLRSVEQALETGLGEMVDRLPDAAKERFTAKGKEIAMQLTKSIYAGVPQSRMVVDLVKAWLLTLPSVNKYFLEQEAKIRTDAIITLARTRHAVV